ncbi:Calx-beta domain-containing protein [Falsiroseomonas bella]|uniref:Calx-beta domain-containing protein n=1 Tax=Falsiroseomonas bella TaxID=2184016 RepID=UPI001304EEBC|nr:Calx-beta domain-containing protein [Falsiroseomonas bella]
MRDPLWSVLNATSLRLSLAWQSQDGVIALQPDTEIGIGDRSALLFQAIDATETRDILGVDLTAGNLYYFWVAAAWQPVIEIFDAEGYRLLSLDGDDIGFPDLVGEDSILFFAPEVSGRHHLRIGFVDPARKGDYVVEAWEDVGANFVNDLEPVVSQVSIEATDAVKREGAAGTATTFTFTLRRTGDLSTQQDVLWFAAAAGTSPAARSDFVDPDSLAERVTFAPGESVKTIAIQVAGDDLVEADETFEVRLAFPSAGLGVGQGVAVGRILTDEMAIAFSPASLAIAEGQSGATPVTVTVTRSGDLAAWSGFWTVEGHGDRPVDAADFVGGSLPLGVLSFAAGQVTAEISFSIQGDLTPEFDEGFLLRVAEPPSGTAFGRTERRVFTTTGTVLDDDSRIGITRISPSTPEGTGEGWLQAFFVHRVAPAGSTHSVAWRVEGLGSTPATGADFAGGVLPSGILTFAPGETVKTIEFRLAGDSLVEPLEEFLVRLSDPSPGITLDAASVAAAILDDDGAVRVEALADQMEEGSGPASALRFRVSRTDTADTQTVDWAILGGGANPVDDADFVGGVLPSGRITFAPGEAVRLVSVLLAGDSVLEAAETAQIALSAPFGGVRFATTTAETTILDDDAEVLFGRDGIAGNEGDAGTTGILVRLERHGHLDREVAIPWTVTPAGPNGQRAEANDFAGGVLPSGTALFAPGATSTSFTIPVAGDTLPEATEWFNVTLGRVHGIVLPERAQTGLIYNDEPRIAMAYSPTHVREGDGGTTAIDFVIRRSDDLSGTDSVGWRVTSGVSGVEAKASARDFAGGVFPSGQVTFAPGEAEKVVTVRVVGDRLVEPDLEYFAFELHTPSAGVSLGLAQASGAIINDDALVTVTPAQPRIAEGTGLATPISFTATRSGDISVAHSLAWSVRPAGTSPVDAQDFVGRALPSGRLDFAPGETVRTIAFSVVGDRLFETDETFALRLTPTSPGLSVAAATLQGTILNDDTRVSVAIDAAVQAEGQPGGTTPFTFTLTRSGPLDLAQSVGWSVAPTGTSRAVASDFLGGVLPSGTVAFAAGEAEKTVTLRVLGDALIEPDESFVLRLHSPTESLQLGTATATATIRNDDASITAAIAAPALPEGGPGAGAVFTVALTRSGDLSVTHDLAWSVAPTGAARATQRDFAGNVLPGGSLSFAPGVTTQDLTIAVQGDLLPEPEETFVLRLSSPSAGVAVATPSLLGTILNDDGVWPG